ncbi:hypothetical protein Q31b_46930 [Novipirellula aureliae]|uniref:Uncharacterized protein n=2 Tax=Novipirellula aureliae TaxID=2527966 RepID=A0A5C6DNX2_9BACT|nr:hypothetical protein Q31b_46930 [Novipirellula aureliae]
MMIPDRQLKRACALFASMLMSTLVARPVMAEVPDSLIFETLFINGQQQILARYSNHTEDAPAFNGVAADSLSKERVGTWKDPTYGYFSIGMKLIQDKFKDPDKLQSFSLDKASLDKASLDKVKARHFKLVGVSGYTRNAAAGRRDFGVRAKRLLAQ